MQQFLLRYHTHTFGPACNLSSIASCMIYLCLNQLHSLGSHTLEPLKHTQSSLSLHLLHGKVEEDECPRSPHPCTAVDQERGGQGDGVLLADTTNERDERHGVAGNSVIRPGGVEHVGDC